MPLEASSVVTTGVGAGEVAGGAEPAPLPPPGAVPWGGSVVFGTSCGGGCTAGSTSGSSGTALPPGVTLSVGGVGSNTWVHPMPASQSSGHACASCADTR